jgi:hypothetical protein
MAGRGQPSGRIRRQCRVRNGSWADNATVERREAGSRFCAGRPRLASVASRLTSATLKASTPPGAPPALSFSGPRDQADATRMQRKARTRTQVCGAGTKKRRLFDIVNENDASGGSGRGVQSRRRQRTRTKAEGAPSCVLRTNDRRASAGVDVAPGPTRARGQPTAVQVPSGLRQALPRATCGLPSI